VLGWSDALKEWEYVQGAAGPCRACRLPRPEGAGTPARVR